ncbi:MAG: enoyl-CoA hydratase/isomerase family protein [bacterium]
MSDPVLYEKLPSGNGKFAGVATLNAEKALNSLSLSMVRSLQPQLDAWSTDDSIACVFLQGAGEKSFCAGGDIVELYNGMVDGGNGPETFFAEEYRLDHTIHTFPKPIVVWGHGVVMGGGLGLMSGASHRVVTERTRMGMPEVTIGLYPDVGGTFFLNRTPGRTGLFLGLTGASINAADAIFVGLADRFITQENRAGVIEALVAVNWSTDSAAHAGQVSHVLRDFEAKSSDQRPPAQVEPHFAHIQKVTDQDSLDEIVSAITAYEGDDKWLSGAAATLAAGCPTTIHLVNEQLTRGKHLSLAECFRMELTMSYHCAHKGNFQEGVRALLIDKDRNPKFDPATLADVTADYIDQHFQAPWSEHPLADL